MALNRRVGGPGNTSGVWRKGLRYIFALFIVASVVQFFWSYSLISPLYDGKDSNVNALGPKGRDRSSVKNAGADGLSKKERLNGLGVLDNANVAAEDLEATPPPQLGSRLVECTAATLTCSGTIVFTTDGMVIVQDPDEVRANAFLNAVNHGVDKEGHSSLGSDNKQPNVISRVRAFPDNPQVQLLIYLDDELVALGDIDVGSVGFLGARLSADEAAAKSKKKVDSESKTKALEFEFVVSLLAGISRYVDDVLVGAGNHDIALYVSSASVDVPAVLPAVDDLRLPLIGMKRVRTSQLLEIHPPPNENSPDMFGLVDQDFFKVEGENLVYQFHSRGPWRSIVDPYLIRVWGIEFDSLRSVSEDQVKNVKVRTVIPYLFLPKVDDFVAPNVSLVITAYNKFIPTYYTVRSAMETTNAMWFTYEVIVVDDCSPVRDMADHMERIIHGINYHRNRKNMGYLKSCNTGLSISRGSHALLLNNDVIVRNQAVEMLFKTFQDHGNVGEAGSKLLFPDGSLQEAGGLIFSNAQGWNYGRGEWPDDPRYNYVRDVDYCSGAAIMVDLAEVRMIGYYDEAFEPAYYEDTDLAFAMRARGKRVVYQPFASVTHFEKLTHGQGQSESLMNMNREHFRHKWADQLDQQFPAPPMTTYDIAATRLWGEGLTVIIIDAAIPTPDQDSGSVRIMHILRILKQIGCHVTFVPKNFDYNGEYTRNLQAMGVEVLYRPYFHSIDQIGALRPTYDLVLVCRRDVFLEFRESIARMFPMAYLVFDTVDVHFIREEREQRLQQIEVDYEPRRVEMGLMDIADMTLVVSSYEKDILYDIKPDLNVGILSNIHELEPTSTPFEQRSGILFIANFYHVPNIDAIRWYVDNVHPLVRELMPDLKLYIIGGPISKTPWSSNYLPDDIQNRVDEGIEVLGQLPTVKEWYERVRLSIAPIRYGAGVKGKVGGSMAFGVPVVATGVAAEGMNLEHGRDVYVADTPQDFAEGIFEVYTNRTMWQGLRKLGFEAIRVNLSLDAAVRSLRAVLQSARTKRDKVGRRYTCLKLPNIVFGEGAQVGG